MIQKGFSLLEMMIVITLMAILSSVAYAGFRATLSRAQRIDAQQSLFSVAVTLEGCYQGLRDYALCADKLGLMAGINSQQGYYQLQFMEGEQKGYVLHAKAQNASTQDWELNSAGALKRVTD